jgi:DNA-binding NtrC family response regulator
VRKVLFVTSRVADARELACRASRSWSVTVPPDIADSPSLAASGFFDFALFDIALTGACVPDLLRGTLAARAGFKVFVLTREYAPCFRELARASGANDYFLIPYSFADLRRRVDEVLGRPIVSEHPPSAACETAVAYGKAPGASRTLDEDALPRDARPSAAGRAIPSCDGLVGESGAMERLRARILDLAGHDATVLIRGETGSGKDLVARLIHEGSPVASGPFVPCNVSAIAESLAESALFGSSKGSYTGSVRDVKGLFEEADGGTLFLDEIGELDLGLQPKFLRVLEEGVVRRLGSQATHRVRFRLICATNRDLSAMVAARRFRADLFYRLDVLRVAVPPLREHPDDIPALARRCLGRYRKGISPRALEKLKSYHWPGNVRQLFNCLARAACETRGSEVDHQHISF